MAGRRLVSQVAGVAAGVTLATITSAVASASPAPVGYEAKVVRAMAIDDLTETGAWTPRGPETSVALDDKIVKVGERYFNFVGFGADLTRSERTQQEGSLCWVYHPRITAGVNYMAFALAMCGEQVPS